MRPSLRLRRLLARTLLAVCFAVTLIVPRNVSGADSDTRLELRPHCIDGDVVNLFGGPTPDVPFMTKPTKGTCHEFAIRDPQTRQTNILRQDDVLDMDLVVRNPNAKNIKRVRAWLAYDPELLEGDSIEIDPGFTQPVPDEQTFSPTDGYIKIGASTDTPLSTATVVVARIRMHVKSVAEAETIISYFHASADTESETVVTTEDATGQEQGLLHPPLGSLLVRLAAVKDTSAASSSQPVPLPASSAASSAAPQPPPPAASSMPVVRSAASSEPASSHASALSTSGIFTMLQVLHLRATTEGTSVYLAWDALKSADLIGYNVYYGTISGEYIQKRSVDQSSTTLTIRDLIPGTRYYFAVRGVNKNNQETDFSQEVAITVGKPETSTSPLFASTLNEGPQGKSPKTGGSVAGNTGIPSSLVLFFIVSATIGTVLAMRRQLIAFQGPHR